MKTVEGVATIDDVDAFVRRLGAIGEDHDCAIQAFDARYLAGGDHVTAAVERATRAFERGDNIADDRSVEILLYAAGRRQIDQALELGVKEGECPIVIVVDGDDEAGATETVRELIDPETTLGTRRDEDRIQTFFDIPDAERAATDADLEALVVERVSLLVIEK